MRSTANLLISNKADTGRYSTNYMSQRQNLFDKNRNMEEIGNQAALDRIAQLELVVQQLEAVVQQQHQQNQVYFQQIQQIQQQQQTPIAQQIDISTEQIDFLTPKDIVEQFRRLKPLDDGYLMQFISSVESTINLCSRNHSLIRFGIQIVCNEKIFGGAGHLVRQLGPQPTWQQVKDKLIHFLQPKMSYADIFNYCRIVKVWNLNELFCIFERAKFDLGEIYDFDENKPGIYSPANVDRDLVHIMLSKIDAPIRAHLQGAETMIDIITKYSKLDLLQDKRAIDYRHRKQRTTSNENYNFDNKNNPKNTNKNENRFSNNRHYKFDSRKNGGNNNIDYSKNNNDSCNYNRNAVNYSNGNKNENLSSRTKNSYMSVDQVENLEDRCMDVSNGEETEVNFLTLPQSANYQ